MENSAPRPSSPLHAWRLPCRLEGERLGSPLIPKSAASVSSAAHPAGPPLRCSWASVRLGRQAPLGEAMSRGPPLKGHCGCARVWLSPDLTEAALPTFRLHSLWLVSTETDMDPDPAAANAALPWVSYNRYILLNMDGNIVEVGHDDAILLPELITNKRMVYEYDLRSTENGLLVLPGETDQVAVYEIASDLSKKIARTILKAIRGNWLCGVCFTDFDGGNVLASSSGKVRFRDVRIRRDLPVEQLAEGTRNNYLSACAVIEDVIYSGNPPPEIRHLLALIQVDEGRELFHIHASLLHVAAYSGFFKEMYDLIRFILPKEEPRALLLGLPEAYVANVNLPNVNVINWQDEVNSNNLLRKTLLYNNAKSYEVPADEPQQTCLNRAQEMALAELGLPQNAGQASLYPVQIRMIKWLKFLDFMRNRAAHRMEPLQWWIDQGKKNFNALGSDFASHVRYPRVLSEVQHGLYRLGRHNDIPMESFF